MDTQVEVRFYSAAHFKNATARDAWGWFVSLHFLPAEITAGADFPDYGMVAIIKQIQLLPSYIGSLITKHNPDAEEVTVQYDGTTLVCAGLSFGETKLVYEKFLKDALNGQPISLRSA